MGSLFLLIDRLDEEDEFWELESYLNVWDDGWQKTSAAAYR